MNKPVFGQCPFCGGSLTTLHARDCPGWQNTYSEETVDKLIAQLKDQETQLAHQTALLLEALEVVDNIIKARESVCLMGSFAFMPIYREAQALAPKIREALEGK